MFENKADYISKIKYVSSKSLDQEFLSIGLKMGVKKWLGKYTKCSFLGPPLEDSDLVGMSHLNA